MAAVAIRDTDGVARLGMSAISISDQIEAEALREAACALREAGQLIELNVFGRREV
jgi:DNA-binding IclR family transcriptional regulator